jgi:hypothetical protein
MYAVWFESTLKNQSQIRSDLAVFAKLHPNILINIWFYVVFDFFRSF